MDAEISDTKEEMSNEFKDLNKRKAQKAQLQCQS